MKVTKFHLESRGFMIEVEEKENVESRCGIECSNCEYKEKVDCQARLNIAKSF